ncbi:MAG: DNA topoisomerase III [Verrucomicrobiota bacterium]|nr:DNA topoisomerase III [Verrucomicrobiota bacterium]
MGKTLVIAEKPSVAQDIARVLGGFKKDKDFVESDDMVISSAIGHLVQICLPAEMDKQKGKWSIQNLPVIPEAFALKPIDRTADRFKVLTKLMKRKDVDSLINACDSGREGELIFHYIYKLVGSKKPVKRLWLQSMTPAAIKEGFAHLRNGEDLNSLAEAAVCRSESDWLVGINGTRALTAFNSKDGGFQLTTVGRVQTPTLAILVSREHKIRNFKAKDYWEVHGTFEAKSGSYTGRWFNEEFKKSDVLEEAEEQKPERIWDETEALALQKKCLNKPGIVSEKKKPTTQMPPLLYDLTSLQREANGRFGFSAKRTLQIAQALYERHKVITYPRTDSRALPEDYISTVKRTMESLEKSPLRTFARTVLDQGWVRPNKRIFNNAKISDHFAIIPTLQNPTKLDEWENRLYTLISQRFVAVFYPAAEFEVTTRITRVESEPFKTEGKILVKAGWMEVYGKTPTNASTKPDDDDDEAQQKTIVPVGDGVTVNTSDVEVRSLQTKPHARFSEATLLSAMEGAGKLIEDEDLREAMSEKGLGTPATRAAIIEGLILESYIYREGRELVVTAKGISLISLLKGIKIPELCSPEMTGEWEFKLKQIEQGKLTRDKFMEEITAMTRSIVEKTKLSYKNDNVPGDYVTLTAPCPKCGGTVKEDYKHYKCATCDFSMFKSVSGRTYEPHEIEALVTHKQIGPLQGFRSKMGRPFAAVVRLNPEFKAEFVFDSQEGANSVAIDFTGQESLGKCPFCTGQVFESAMSYVCEKSVGPERKCTFKSGKVILQRAIPREQMQKLLTNKKTDLLDKFISTRTRRPFSAYLSVADGKKVSFEFEPRAPKKPGATKSRAKKASPKSAAE